jgi:hypothetical protein
VPTVPQLDAGFSFDNGATSVAHADTVAAPVVLPAGAGGLLLEDFVGLGDGTISKIRFIFFGETGAGTHDFEILIFLDNVLMETVPVTCDVNRELIHTLSVPVTSTQAFKMVIRASDLTEQEPEWAVVNYYVYVSVPWQFDTPLTGTFVGTRVLSEGV